jgi:hypothetical protein
VDRSTFNQHRLDLFWWFVCERQTIWRKRVVERLPPPWTDDPVLQTERFTNVYRELDPGTRYAIDEILERDESPPDKIFNVMLYRLIGRKETHQSLGFQRLACFSGDHLRRTLRDIRDSGQPPFTAAYMVGAYTSMGTRDKVENVARLFERLAGNFQSIYQRINVSSSAEEVHAVLASVYGFGDFLAYQVLVDLLYPLRVDGGEPLLPFSHNDWAKAGPGARRGIRIMVSYAEQYPSHRPRKHRGVLPYEQAPQPSDLAVMRSLRDHQDDEFRRLGRDFPYLTDSGNRPVQLTLANVQNCLCEFHKYVKIRDGTGRGRRKIVTPISMIPTPLWNADRHSPHR